MRITNKSRQMCKACKLILTQLLTTYSIENKEPNYLFIGRVKLNENIFDCRVSNCETKPDKIKVQTATIEL